MEGFHNGPQIQLGFWILHLLDVMLLTSLRTLIRLLLLVRWHYIPMKNAPRTVAEGAPGVWALVVRGIQERDNKPKATFFWYHRL